MKQMIERTNTSTKRFSTRTIAMVLSIVMLIGSIATGSMLSTFAAYLKDSANSDAVTQAAAEGGDIALNAIPSEDSADEADAKPALAGFEENKIVRGMKDDFAAVGANADIASTGWDGNAYLQTKANKWGWYDNANYQVAISSSNTAVFTIDLSGEEPSDNKWYFKVIANNTCFASGLEIGDNGANINKTYRDDHNYSSVSAAYINLNTFGLTNKTITLTVKFENDYASVSWAKVTEDWYVIGHQFDTGWSTDSKDYQMTESGDEYYIDRTVTAKDDYFRLHNTKKEIVPGGADVKAEFGTEYNGYKFTTGDKKAWYIDSTFAGKIRIHWNPSTSKLMVERRDFEIKLPTSHPGYSVTATDGTTAATTEGVRYDKDKTITVTVTPDSASNKVTAITAGTNTVSDVVDNHDGTYSATFSPTADATIEAAIAAKQSYTVNYASNNNSYGTVAATKGDAAIASGATVLEGDAVTFTATPAAGYALVDWTGLSGSNPTTTVYVTGNLNVTGNFAVAGFRYVKVAATNVESDMTELPNGWYISGAIAAGDTFTIRNTATGNYLDARASGGKYEWKSGWEGSGSKADASNWIATVPTTSSTTTVYWNNTGGVRYFVYDPETSKVWVADNDGARDKVILLAKDGTIRDWDEKSFTSDFGDTTVTRVTPATLDGSTEEKDAYDDRAERYVFSSKDVNSGVTVTIKTTVDEEYAKKGYYVKGFVVSTREESYAVLKQEFVDEAVVVDGTDTYPEKERAAYKDPTVYDKIHGVYTESTPGDASTRTYTELPYNEFTFSIEGNPGTIEVTPVYFIAEEKSGDNVRFYAEGFAGDVKENWGGTLAVDVYGSGEGSRPYGEFPGQPLINYNGRYLMDIPRTNIQGITMNNYRWDKAHSNEFNITTNYQTYDYNDFYYINEKEKVLGSDEDIIFSFRYKSDENHNTQGTSNLADRVYYKDSTAIYGEGKTEYEGGTYHADDYRTGYETMTLTHEAMYHFEALTDFYGNRVDLFGDVINEESDKGQYNPLRVVSNGYDLNKAGRFATAWAIYDPTKWTGNDPGTYNLVDVIGGQGKTDQSFQSESFLIDPGSEARVRFKYDASIRNNNNPAKDIYADYSTYFGDVDNATVSQYWEKKFQAQNGGSTSYPELIADLVGVPVDITYEYEVNDGWSNKDIDQVISGYKQNDAYRSDGRWYFSNSKQKVTSHIIVEYANKEAGPFTRDYFQSGRIDYTQEDYDKTAHEGLNTRVKAYFKNNEDEENADYVIKNTEGDTEASGITDGESTFKLYTEPDEDGDYTFVGWYLLNKDGSTTRFSTDSYYEAEVTNNDVFIARYIKTPAGSLRVNHLLTEGSAEGAATCYVKVEVMTGDTVKYTYNETPNTINVSPTYIKSTSTDNLRITLRTDPKAFYKFINFYNESAGTNILSDSVATGRDSFINATTIQDVDFNTNTIVFRTNQINTLFSGGEARTEPLNLYSKVELPNYNYEIVYYYDSYRNKYGEQHYTVRDSFSYDELTKYMNLTGDELAFNDNQGESGKTTFISNHAPFEDDFQKTISYEQYTLKQTRSYNKETLTLYLDVKAADITDNSTVYVKFNLPYAVNSDALLVPQPDSQTNKVKMLATSNPDVTPKAVTTYNWFVTSGKQSKKDKEHVADPVFVQAPLIIYDNQDNARYFKYWKVEKQGKNGAAPIEYTRCYDYQFNLSIFMDCIVTPVYTEVNEPWVQTVNPPTTWDMYNRFDFILAQKMDNQDLRISFLENSRNQYNEGGRGTRTTNTNAADVIYSDFLLNFNCEAKDENGDPILFKDGDANKKHVGLIVEAVDFMSGDGENKFDYTKDYSSVSHYTSMGQSEDNLKKWISGEITDRLPGCGKTEFDAKNLDNKNCMQYFYSLNNQTGNSSANAPLIDNLWNRYKVFRAYAYIGDYDAGTGKILNNEKLKLSAPVYFTIYDVASMGLKDTKSPIAG